MNSETNKYALRKKQIYNQKQTNKYTIRNKNMSTQKQATQQVIYGSLISVLPLYISERAGK